MKNSIIDVRNILIEQMEKLNDPDTEVDMERVKQINNLGKTLVDSAKAEALYINAVSGLGKDTNAPLSGFIKRPKELT